MFRLIEAIISDPQVSIQFLGAIPGIIATVLMALVGHHFWFHKIGTHFRTIGIGALLGVLAYINGFAINALLGSYLPVEQLITVISANQLIAGLGHLLFCLGIYRWIRTKRHTNPIEESNRGPFMT